MTANAPARKFSIDPEVHQRGAQVYANTCVACHGLDAKGVAGAFPPLAGSDWITGDPTIPIRVVMHGLTGSIKVGDTEFNSIMPPVVRLTERDIASVLTYVRQSFGNDAAPVTEAEVRQTRQRNRGRRDPWTATELRSPAP